MPSEPEAASGTRRRLHPVSILFILGAQARSFLVPGLFVLFAARRSDDPSVWAMVLIVPYTLVAILRYLSFRYAYLADELVIESGFVFRKRRHVPYGRIHNIGSVENPLHRAFGVAEVRVETAGGDEPEARIRVLSRDALEEMRRRVAAAKVRGVAGETAAAATVAGEGGTIPEPAAAAAAPPGRELVRLGVKDLVLYGLIDNRGIVVAGAVLGLAWQSGLLDRIGGRAARSRGGWADFPGWSGGWELGELPGLAWEWVWRSLQEGASPLRVGLAVLAVLVLFLVVVRLLSLGWAFYKLWGFRLVLAGRELASESGLLTRVRAAVPLHRIQTVTVAETPLHRLFRRLEVSAETAGGKSGSGQGRGDRERQRLAPILRRDELPALLAEVLPGLDLGAVEWHPVDPRGERRMRRVRIAWAAVFGAGAALAARPLGGAPLWWGLGVFAALAALGVWVARKRIRRLGWAVTDDDVLYRSGGLWRHLTVARGSKVQAVGLDESPFDRRWGMATLRLDTAGAAMTSHRLHVPYLARPTARELFDLLERRAAATAFRW